MGQPSTALADWRWAQATDARNWIENAHVDLSSPNSWLDTAICLRILLYNSGDKVEDSGYKIRYRVDAGTWTDVTTSSSYVRATDHPYRTDGQGTSQELGSGTFDEGYWDEDGSVASFQLASGQEAENEHCITFRSAECPGHTVEVSIFFDDNGNLDGYTYSDPSCVFTGVDDCVADDLSTGTPTLGQPDIGQVHALAANDLATGSPVLDQPTAGHVHNLSADNLSTGAPTLDQPTAGHIHNLSADDLATGAPVLDQPDIGQEHVLYGRRTG